MAYLTWIGDADLRRELQVILSAAKGAKQEAELDFEKNVIDPFAMIFEMYGFGISDFSDWKAQELGRKAQKSLANKFGTFHQGILGSIHGWEDLGTGSTVDLVNYEKKIIAEVKNKYNTTKGDYKSALYETLEGLITPKASKYHGFTAYYVEVIPKPKRGQPQNYDEEFTPSDNKKGASKPANPKIRVIDGQSFYKLATGESSALLDLFESLPKVLDSMCGDSPAMVRDTDPLSASALDHMEYYFQRAWKSSDGG